jgi:dephospho-CoA kinase
MKTPLQVGITGGIGSGKSYVSHWFEAKGYPVYRSDERAKAVMTDNQALRENLLTTFGRQVFASDGQLNRPYLAELAFRDVEALTKLNAIVHPAVIQDYVDWVQQIETVKPFLLKEAAILFESGTWRASDYNIEVYAPLGLRIERVMARDGVPASTVWERICRQWPESRKLLMADYIVYNDSRVPLEPQLQALEAWLYDKHA